MNAVATTNRIPSSSAACTAQIAVTVLIVVVTGVAMPGRISGGTVWLSPPYQTGIMRVNTKLATPTSSSGATASKGCGKPPAPVSTRSGSFTSEVP